MGRNIEIEFKNMLSKEDFTRLKEYFHIDEKDFITQINHYFDTEALSLGQKKAALRIREKNGSFELTLKKIVKAGILEINQTISAGQARDMFEKKVFPAGEVLEELTLLHIVPESLNYKGELLTRRAHASYKNGQVMLDHSTYFGKEDFEMEYEVDEEDSVRGEEDFYRLLNGLHIPLMKTDNKIKRFFDAKEEGSF